MIAWILRLIGIYKCECFSKLERKIVKDALFDYDPEDDMYEERTSEYKYEYTMDDVKALRDKYSSWFC